MSAPLPERRSQPLCPCRVRLLIRDRGAARRSLDEILRWDFDRVIVTHGIVLQQSGKRVVRAAFDWL